jgi:hypothetical protein
MSLRTMVLTTAATDRSVGLDVDSEETESHAFVVRIWLEEVSASGRALWRGHITHVPSGRRRYVQRLGDITTFIAPYVDAMGARIGVRWKIQRRLQQWLGVKGPSR